MKIRQLSVKTRNAVVHQELNALVARQASNVALMEAKLGVALLLINAETLLVNA